MSFYASYPSPGPGVPIYPNLAAFPSGAVIGQLAVAADTGILYEWRGSSWQVVGGTGTIIGVGTFDSGTPSSNGAHIDSNLLIMQSASTSNPGLVNISTQSFVGAKTFTGSISTPLIGLLGSSSGSLGMNVPASVTSYTLTWPAVQGGISTFLKNDGSGGLSWAAGSGGSGVDSIGTIDSQSKNADGLTIVGTTLYAQTADATNPGMVSNSTQTFSGAKTFSTAPVLSSLTASLPLQLDGSKNIVSAAINLSGSQATGTLAAGRFPALTGDVTTSAGSLATALVATTNSTITTLSSLSLPASQLTGTGNLTDAGTDGIIVTNGGGAVIGAGTSIAQHVADTSHNGYLSSTDWNTFNGKQASGSYITALTGDVTANGPGSVAATVAKIQGTVVSGTTGATNVVFSVAPTLSNPVVGTQSQGDASTKAASTAYVDTAVANAVAGVNPAVAVQAATTAAGDTSGFTYNNGASGVGATFTGTANTAITIDGFTFTALGQRLLVKNDTQSPSGAFNGIYYVTQVQTSLLAPILTRALDYNTPTQMNNTGAIPVINGTANGTTQWVQTGLIVTVGTTPLVFVQFTKNPAAYLLVANNLSDVANKATSFNNLSPMTTGGDIIYGGSSGAGTRLANGSSGQVLTSSGSTSAPTWQTPTGGAPAYSFVSQSSTLNPAIIGSYYILSGASFTITLPTAASIAGQSFIFQHNGTSLTNVYTFNTTSSQTINGANGAIASGSYKLFTNGETIALVSDGSNWQISQHIASTPWSSGTANTITGTTTNPTKGNSGSPPTDTIIWQRQGNLAHIAVHYKQTNATGSAAGSGDYLFAMPTNLTIDTAITGTDSTVYGSGAIASPAMLGSSYFTNNTTSGTGNVIIASSTTFKIGGGTAGVVSSGVVSLANTITVYNADFWVPISNWQP